VWDGKPARAYGGTADVVAYAREQGTPVRVIWRTARLATGVAGAGTQNRGVAVDLTASSDVPGIYLAWTSDIPGLVGKPG